MSRFFKNLPTRTIVLEEGVRRPRTMQRAANEMRLLLCLWINRPFWFTAAELTGMLQASRVNVGKVLAKFIKLNYVEKRKATPDEKLDRGHVFRMGLPVYRMAEEFEPTISLEGDPVTINH